MTHRKLFIAYFFLLEFGYVFSSLDIAQPAVQTDQSTPQIALTTPEPLSDTSALQWERQSLLQDEGVTTTAQEQRGNWYFKRQILKEAGPLHEAIRDKDKHVEQAFKDIIARRTRLDADVNTFLHESHISNNKVEAQLALQVDAIVNLEAKKGLTHEEKKNLDEHAAIKQRIEDLQVNIAYIQELDISLDKALSIASEQVNLCHSFAKKAWNNYDEIAEVLDDVLAEKLFFEMQGYNNNIDAITVYIMRDFTQYISQIENIITEYKTTIKNDVQELKKKNIIITAEINPEVSVEPVSDSEATLSTQLPSETQTHMSLFSKIGEYISAIAKKIYEFITYFLTLFKK